MSRAPEGEVDARSSPTSAPRRRRVVRRVVRRARQEPRGSQAGARLAALVAAARVGLSPSRREAAAARWRPLGRGVARGLAFAARVVGAVGSTAWERRDVLGRVGHRLACGLAFVLLWLAGRAFLGDGADPSLAAWLEPAFITGLTLAALVVLLAPERRLRLAGLALAAAHGTAAVLGVVVGI